MFKTSEAEYRFIISSPQYCTFPLQLSVKQLSSSTSSLSTQYCTMWSSNSSNKKQQKQEMGGGLSDSFRVENFLPGLIIGFIFGLFMDLSSPSTNKKTILPSKARPQSSDTADHELKLVLVVRQDLKMGAGKIASQCAHAATGMYAELIQSQRLILRQWEQCGQPKIVVTCKNQQEMNKIKEAAESTGLPTYVVADAGRTQVSAGSKTVLAVGPGPKSSVDAVTGKLRLL